MSKLVKEKSLFGGNRRESVLVSYQVLQTKANEKRLKLLFKLPISNRALVGIPEWVANSYQPMEEDDSAQSMCKLDRMLEGMTMQVFATDQSHSAALTLTGVTVKDLKLVREGEDEKSEVFLYATIYSPANIQARDWAWESLRATFYAAFEYSQTELEFGSDVEEVDQEEPDGEENYMSHEHDAEFATVPAAVIKQRGRKKTFANA